MAGSLLNSIRRVTDRGKPNHRVPPKKPRDVPEVAAWAGTAALVLSIFAIVLHFHHLRHDDHGETQGMSLRAPTHILNPNHQREATCATQDSEASRTSRRVGSRRGRVFHAPRRLYGMTFYPEANADVYVADAKPHVKAAAVFEGDIVVTGSVYALGTEKNRPPTVVDPHVGKKAPRSVGPWAVYRDVHVGSSRIGRCGPTFLSRKTVLFVYNDNVSLDVFQTMRGLCCVDPRNTSCAGWNGFITNISDAGGNSEDLEVLSKRQEEIYETSDSLLASRESMDVSTYFMAPSRTFVLTGMALSVWNASRRKTWLPRVGLSIPPTPLRPADAEQDRVHAVFSAASRTFNTSIVPVKRGVLDDTGTFLFKGHTMAFMVSRPHEDHFPLLGSGNSSSACTRIVEQAEACLAEPSRKAICTRELYTPAARSCCDALAASRIFVHC